MSASRLAAWSALRGGAVDPLLEVDAQAERFELDRRDRGLVRQMVGISVRRLGTLRAITNHFLEFKAKPDLVAHLHLGLVQMLFLDRVPDHAAVSETNDAVRHSLGPSKVRYSNAILRRVQRARRRGVSGDPRRDLVGRDWHFDEPLFRDPAEHPLLWCEDALSLPAQLGRRWAKRHGDEKLFELARLALAEPDLSVRVVRGERDAHRAELEALGIQAAEGAHPGILRIPSDATEDVIGGEAFARGDLTVQGEAALRAAELVEAREGERVLDLCAAPGGKTAVLAQAGAEVVATDVSNRRLSAARETLDRLGLTDRARFVTSDGTAGLEEGETFDAALVDAPCSNTGVLASRPAARWRFGPKELASLAEVQERLLAEAAERVRPGGRLVWSTCSLEPEENERRVRAFVESRPEWSLEAQVESLPGAAPGPVDGGAAFRLRREGGS